MNTLGCRNCWFVTDNTTEWDDHDRLPGHEAVDLDEYREDFYPYLARRS